MMYLKISPPFKGGELLFRISVNVKTLSFNIIKFGFETASKRDLIIKNYN